MTAVFDTYDDAPESLLAELDGSLARQLREEEEQLNQARRAAREKAEEIARLELEIAPGVLIEQNPDPWMGGYVLDRKSLYALGELLEEASNQLKIGSEYTHDDRAVYGRRLADAEKGITRLLGQDSSAGLGKKEEDQ